jgi:hypothetical protein
MYTHDLFVGHVELDVADPESQSTVGRDVDASDRIVPEPRDGDEVTYGDGNDRAVGADGDGSDQYSNEYRLENEEAELECCCFRFRSFIVSVCLLVFSR